MKNFPKKVLQWLRGLFWNKDRWYKDREQETHRILLAEDTDAPRGGQDWKVWAVVFLLVAGVVLYFLMGGLK